MSIPSIIAEEEFQHRALLPREPRTIGDNQQNALVKALTKIRPAAQQAEHKALAKELSYLPAFNNMNMNLLAVAVQVINVKDLKSALQSLIQAQLAANDDDTKETKSKLLQATVNYESRVRAALETKTVEPLFNNLSLVTSGDERPLSMEERGHRLVALRAELLTYISAVLSQ